MHKELPPHLSFKWSILFIQTKSVTYIWFTDEVKEQIAKRMLRKEPIV